MICSARKFYIIAIVIVSLLASLPLVVLAGSTGQIKGKVTDNKTGEPVIGASVFIVGTKMGATTDLDGFYIIPRVDPGIYTVRITHLDYTTVDVTEVEVKVDLTTEQNRALDQKVTELDEVITVIGQRDILDKFETSSQVSISQETSQT